MICVAIRLTLTILLHTINVISCKDNCQQYYCTNAVLDKLVNFESKQSEFDKKLLAMETEKEKLARKIGEQQVETEISKAQIAQLEIEKENLAQIVQDMRNEIEAQVTALNWAASAPGFTVRLAINFQTSHAMETIIFSHVVTNVDNGYNATDGVFCPPVSGRYVFSLSVRSYNRGDAHAGVIKNNKIVGMALSIGGRQIWGSTGAVSLVLDLYSEDKVRVAGLYANETYHGITTYFTGYLLYPM